MHPILFRIGNFPVGTYGLMIVIGIVAGVALASILAKRRGISPEFIQDLAMWALVSGFVGARAVFVVVETLNNTEASLSDLVLSRGGFVFQGGAFVAIGVCAWYIVRHKQPLFEVADLAAPALVLAHAFGRIGCFFAGCCYGLTCGDPSHPHPVLSKIAVQYPLLTDPKTGMPLEMFNYAYAEQVHNKLIEAGSAPLPIVPVQLFESAGNFLICAFLVWMWRRRRFSGQVAALYLGLYACLRFGLEFLRGDTERGVWLGGNLTTGQINSLIMLAVGVALWVMRQGKGLDPIPAPAGPDNNIPGHKRKRSNSR